MSFRGNVDIQEKVNKFISICGTIQRKFKKQNK